MLGSGPESTRARFTSVWAKKQRVGFAYFPGVKNYFLKRHFCFACGAMRWEGEKRARYVNFKIVFSLPQQQALEKERETKTTARAPISRLPPPPPPHLLSILQGQARTSFRQCLEALGPNLLLFATFFSLPATASRKNICGGDQTGSQSATKKFLMQFWKLHMTAAVRESVLKSTPTYKTSFKKTKKTHLLM